MLLPRVVVWMLSLALMVLGASTASAQDPSTGSGQVFPNRPLRLVAGSVGGGSDFAARLIATGLSSSLGQSVITDNRGGDIIPGEIVARAPPDGHTLLLTGSSFWLVPFLYSSVPWEPVKDFSPIILVGGSPNIILAHPSLPVNSVKELIALAKAKPGELTYSTGSAGAPNRIAGELFMSMAGVSMARIPYKGGGPALFALLAGEVQLTFVNVSAAAPYLKSGKVKALAVTSLQPSLLAPNLPTVSASGLPGYESGTSYHIYATAKTPAATVKRLNQEIARELNKADVSEKFFNVGVKVAPNSPEELMSMMKAEITKWGKVIKDAGIKPE